MEPKTESRKDNNFILESMKNCIENEQLYRELYKQLYENVTKMLVENKKQNLSPDELLNNWDKIRDFGRKEIKNKTQLYQEYYKCSETNCAKKTAGICDNENGCIIK